jgi:hypothetical protein
VSESRVIACRVWVRSPEGKRQCGRNKRRWEDNVKMVILEIQGD